MINRDQIIDLLSVVATYDRRTVGEMDVRAYGEAAERAGWTFDEAVEAVHRHFATSTAWLMPGHITDTLRAQRSAPRTYERELPPATPSQQARASHLQRIFGELAKRRALPADVEHAGTEARREFDARRRARSVPCPWCHAGAGVSCESSGRPLRSTPYHPSRLAAADAMEVPA